IRGPGSVLWGPDAFAGIVNLVPLTGKDVNGVDAGVSYGAPGDQESFYINMGRDGGHWDAFLSLGGRNGEEDTTFCNIARFWKTATKPYSPEDRYGEEWPGNAQYLTVAGNFSFRDWITLSGMISDYSRPYAMTGPDRDLTWRESRSAPFGFFKIEAKKDIDEVSALRFTGTYSRVNPEIEIINRTLNSKEQATYAELIYDRSFLAGKTLVTGGLSFREKDITDATIWESYFPDYLSESNELLLPILKMEDYRTQLLSAFCQFRQKIGAVDFWLGFRYDDHNAYKDHVSYNAGAVWKPSSQWLLKALYGTAYRTPFARQLRLEDEPELESIETGNLQIAWKPARYVSMTATGYLSRVRNHTMEDAYAGLSQPNRQDSEGVELECTVTPSEKLEVAANLTLLDNDGPDETYHYNDYSYFDPVEGKWVKHYTDLRYPFDTGAKSLFNLLCTWRPFDHLSLFGRIGYVGPRDLVYARGEAFRSLPGVWLADLSSVLRNIAGTGLDLRVSVKNLTDRDYETPGTYSTIWGDPLSAEIMLSKRW
ncbi:MAG: TonB-dependent receptor, partial [Deltaproteobacteria bacterium]|nr:TonB-dependent receptor [Deltaproteobacteria bacterium]